MNGDLWILPERAEWGSVKSTMPGHSLNNTAITITVYWYNRLNLNA